MAADWFEERERLEKTWGRWTKKVRARGLALTVRIPLDRIWSSIEREFVLTFEDGRGGDTDRVFVATLRRETVRSLATRIRQSIPGLPIGACANCGRRALLRNANLDISNIGEVPVVRLCCEPCVQRALTLADRARTRMMRKMRREGFRYVLDMVLKSKADGREYFDQSFHTRRPGAADARKRARKHSCRLVSFTANPLSAW